MDQTETTMNSAPQSTGSKKKIIVIAAIIAAAVLVVAGIIIAVVLNNRYLDNMKDYSPVDTTIYNGYEIVNEDGLYYLTKNGKKVSKTGYTMLESVNTSHYEDMGVYTLDKGMAKFYDYFIARKEDATTYFLLDGEGEEYVITNENVTYEGSILPFVAFEHEVSGKYGVISLDALDSDLSTLSGDQITMEMYDSVEPANANENEPTAFIIGLADHTPGADSPKYYYANAQGKIMFTSIGEEADAEIIGGWGSEDLTAKDFLFLCAGGNLYNGVGELINTDIKRISAQEDAVVAFKNPESDNVAVQNIGELIVYADNNVTFSVDNAYYYAESASFYENLMVVQSRTTSMSTVYDLTTGTQTSCESVNAYSVDGVLVLVNGANCTYVDTETGKNLLTTPYGDMTWYHGNHGVLHSYSADAVNVSGGVTLYFVAPGKNAVSMTLNVGEGISQVFTDGAGCSAYMITNVNSAISSEFSITKESLYVPFANGAVKTASYDDIQVLNVFAEGAPIALATDYDSNKYDYINVASGTVIKSVAPGNGENMALTSVDFVDTYALFNDYDEGVEFAVFKTIIKDTNGNVAKEEWYAFSRNQVMMGEEDYSSAPKSYAVGAVTVTDLGNDIDDINAPGEMGEYAETGEYREAGKYMIVNISDWSSDIYEITAEYTLKKLCNIPYYASEMKYYGTDLASAYILVENLSTDEVALYDLNGEMILGFHDRIEVTYDGEYLIVTRQGAQGAYKYDTEKGRIKQILDFEYSYIMYVGDGGFMAREAAYGGEYYLYDGKSLAKSDPITSYFAQSNYYIDEESGKLMESANIYYNIAGKLYVHRSEGIEVVDTEIVGINVNGNNVNMNDTAPTLVVFRDTAGQVIQSKVVYPTAKGIFEFQMADSGNWYEVSTKDLQKEKSPITAEEIKEMITYGYDDGIINVYKSHDFSTVGQ